MLVSILNVTGLLDVVLPALSVTLTLIVCSPSPNGVVGVNV
jgi:hypothetical protein